VTLAARPGARASQPALAGRGLTRTFDGGAVAPLVDVDVEVHPGQVVAVIGASGSGKTTLLNVLGLLDRPDRGEVLVGGRACSGLRERDRARLRARNLGFVFQDSLVDPRRTAAENVALATIFAGVAPADRRDRVRAALAAADIGHRAHTLAAHLSGGERQRVAVARAVAHRPAVLLCDEPTGNLDEVQTERVFDLLTGFAAAGGAVMLVTHDLELARRCSVTWLVRRGGLTCA